MTALGTNPSNVMVTPPRKTSYSITGPRNKTLSFDLSSAVSGSEPAFLTLTNFQPTPTGGFVHHTTLLEPTLEDFLHAVASLSPLLMASGTTPAPISKTLQKTFAAVLYLTHLSMTSGSLTCQVQTPGLSRLILRRSVTEQCWTICLQGSNQHSSFTT